MWALVAASVLAACGQSFTYVKNSADKTYLRLPRTWSVIEVAPPASGSTGELPQPWQRVFDAAEPADVKHAELFEPPGVVGKLTVFYISPKTADGLSAGDLRAAVSPLDTDPVAASESDTSQQGVVRQFFVEAREGGLRGSRVVYNVQTESGGTVVFDQTTLLDPDPYPNPINGNAMFKVYALSVHCATACYDKAKAEIDRVVTSWTVVP
jgi:hypothetical protein